MSRHTHHQPPDRLSRFPASSHVPHVLLPTGALALGYANIFVTAPSPENLRTLFEFVFKGLDAAGYQVRAATRVYTHAT